MGSNVHQWLACRRAGSIPLPRATDHKSNTTASSRKDKKASKTRHGKADTVTRFPRLPEFASLSVDRRILGQWCFMDRQQMSTVIQGHEGCVNSITWNATDSLLISGSDDCHANIWSYIERRTVASLHTGHSRNIFGAKFVPNTSDRQFVTCAADGETRFHDIGDGSIKSEVLYSGINFSVKCDFHPEQSNVFLTSSADHTVRLFDVRDRSKGNVIVRLRHGITAISFDPFSPSHFAIGADDPLVRVFDLRRPPAFSVIDSQPTMETWAARALQAFTYTTQPQLGLRDGVGVSGLDYSRFVPGDLVVNYRDEEAYLFNTRLSCPAGEDFSTKFIQQYSGRANLDTFAKEIAFMNAGAFVATGGDCGNLYVWEKVSGKLCYKMRADSCIVNCIAPQRDAPVFAVSGIDHTIKLWECHADPKPFAQKPTASVAATASSPSAMNTAKTHHKHDDDSKSDEDEDGWEDVDSKESSGNSDDDDDDDDDEEEEETSFPSVQTILDANSARTGGLHGRMMSALDVVTIEEARRRIDLSDETRARANDLFKQNKVREAYSIYTTIPPLLAFHCPSADLAGAHRQSVILVRLNLAACHLHHKEYDQAIGRCNQVLALDPANVKALYRKAQAQLEIKDFAGAESSLHRAFAIAPQDASLRSLNQALQAKKKESEALEKLLFKRMFQGPSASK